ncbi:response regulator [Phenylobacterium sp. LjRoot225]|uniref:ATP-binding protein n=1 Tax=Phenylobacterium sp. LjRoot225 TaxID=3342285 RepID=UPI003ED11B83
MAALLDRISRKITLSPTVAIGVAAALLILSLALGIYNARAGRAEGARQAQVQADILAASVAGALAFEDRTATQEYVNALRANPAVEAAGAYDGSGQLAAGFQRAGPPLPSLGGVRSPVFDQQRLSVTAPVTQGTTRLGSVFLRLSTETWARRAIRYVGIAAVIVMASLLVAVLGASHARLREAHGKLQREIKERQKVEDALRQSQKMEAMGQLTGGVAHDFNNLLMVASSGLDLMDRTSDPVRRDRLKQGIRQAIDRGASLTQQLLAFARRAPVRPEVINLHTRLTGMRDLLDRSLREDVTVDIQPAPDLWPVEVDPSALELAILNTAINARDAMPSGGAITIKAVNIPAEASRAAADVVCICIIDTGVGVAPDLVERVFEPFFTTKGVGQGTGLGLSQVYGFARSSGGEVEFQSELGKGSTVCIRIPRSLKTAPADVPVHAVVDQRGARRRRVLLVEDDDNVAQLVGEMLEELGYGATRASDAASALEILRRESSFDLVFSDMVMPGEMNGLDLADEIAIRRPGLPIVLTTGYSATATAAAAKGIRLLVKPYRIDALATELQAALVGEPLGMRSH